MFNPCSRCSLAFWKLIYLHSIGTLGASISSLIPAVSCRRCSPNSPFARLEMLTAERP
jgi:hypothetical protein